MKYHATIQHEPTAYSIQHDAMPYQHVLHCTMAPAHHHRRPEGSTHRTGVRIGPHPQAQGLRWLLVLYLPQVRSSPCSDVIHHTATGCIMQQHDASCSDVIHHKVMYYITQQHDTSCGDCMLTPCTLSCTAQWPLHTIITDLRGHTSHRGVCGLILKRRA